MMRDTLQHLAPSASAASALPLPPRPSALAASSATKLRFLIGLGQISDRIFIRFDRASVLCAVFFGRQISNIVFLAHLITMSCIALHEIRSLHPHPSILPAHLESPVPPRPRRPGSTCARTRSLPPPMLVHIQARTLAPAPSLLPLVPAGIPHPPPPPPHHRRHLPRRTRVPRTPRTVWRSRHCNAMCSRCARANACNATWYGWRGYGEGTHFSHV